MTDNKLKNFLNFIGNPKAKVYYYLFNSIVRGCIKDDSDYDSWSDDDFTRAYMIYDLTKAFYDKGLLVASETQKNIGKFLGSSETTVTKHIRSLVNDKAIISHRYLVTDEHYYRFYVNVYILGHVKDGKEIFLINDKLGFNVGDIINTNKIDVDNTLAFFGGVMEVNANEW